MQKRFVSWAAVSSLPQAKKISLQDQLETNKAHVARWDGVLVDELVVPGESRSIVLFEDAARKMDAYAKLKELIAKRAFDVFVYLDRSRLGRKAALSMAVIELCQQAGIITYPTESPPSSLDPPEQNFHNQVVGALESVLAQQEVVKIQHRHEMGMAARVRNGDFPGRVPYGWTARYEVENDKPIQIVEVDDGAKQAIEIIYDLYLNSGASAKTITAIMKERAIEPPRGAAWTESAVVIIIGMALRYAGIVELNIRSKKRSYVRAKLRWPPLISEETAKAVVAMRASRAVAKRSVDKGVHLFSRVVWCRKCERPMIAHYTWRPSRRDKTITKRVENYRCTVGGAPTHDKYQISAHYLIDSVHKAIEFVRVESNRQHLLASYTDKTPQIKRAIEKATKRLVAQEEATLRADDAYVMGKMSVERYQRQIEKLDQQRARLVTEIKSHEAALQNEIADSQLDQRLLDFADEGLVMLASEDIPAANAWFRRHIKLWVDNEDPEGRVQVEYI